MGYVLMVDPHDPEIIEHIASFQQAPSRKTGEAVMRRLMGYVRYCIGRLRRHVREAQEEHDEYIAEACLYVWQALPRVDTTRGNWNVFAYLRRVITSAYYEVQSHMRMPMAPRHYYPVSQAARQLNGEDSEEHRQRLAAMLPLPEETSRHAVDAYYSRWFSLDNEPMHMGTYNPEAQYEARSVLTHAFGALRVQDAPIVYGVLSGQTLDEAGAGLGGVSRQAVEQRYSKAIGRVKARILSQ